MGEIIENLSQIKLEIEKLSKNAELIAVSKYRNVEEIYAAIGAGQRVFGENRVQESLTKWPGILNDNYDIELHLIGSLQRNKVKDAIGLFDVIQSLDRKKLAFEIAKEIKRTGKEVSCYIQVNTGNEPQKGGVLLAEADELIIYSKELGLDVAGLMCIPPTGENSEAHFQILKKLADKHNLTNLSMGMSSDYKEALRVGATHIRVGTAIFGSRGV